MLTEKLSNHLCFFVPRRVIEPQQQYPGVGQPVSDSQVAKVFVHSEKKSSFRCGVCEYRGVRHAGVYVANGENVISMSSHGPFGGYPDPHIDNQLQSPGPAAEYTRSSETRSAA
jgi:hypothetical protein